MTNEALREMALKPQNNMLKLHNQILVIGLLIFLIRARKKVHFYMGGVSKPFTYKTDNLPYSTRCSRATICDLKLTLYHKTTVQGSDPWLIHSQPVYVNSIHGC